jgi:formylglycine-generating enzyme required for sulfatase activity
MAAAVVPYGCSLALDWDSRSIATPLDGAAIGDGPSTDKGRSDAGAPVSPDGAPVSPDSPDAGGCAAGMVSAGSYCIDATEVTNVAYAAFLEAHYDPSLQPPECSSWKADFTPEKWSPTTLLQQPRQPVVNVDWCDAFAFCAWAGKRLCGRIGGGNASGSPTTGSQWFEACSKSGARTFPYGDTYRPAACAVGVNALVDVGSMPSCEGSYSGLFDMSGNVAEWEDACASAGPTDDCAIRGGSYQSTDQEATCAAQSQSSRRRGDDTIGFRCCSP